MERENDFERLLAQRLQEKRDRAAHEAARAKATEEKYRAESAAHHHAYLEEKQRWLPAARAERERTLQAAHYAARVLLDAHVRPKATLSVYGPPSGIFKLRRTTYEHGWTVRRSETQASVSENSHTSIASEAILLTQRGGLVHFGGAIIMSREPHESYRCEWHDPRYTYYAAPSHYYMSVIGNSDDEIGNTVFGHQTRKEGDEQWLRDALVEAVVQHMPSK